MATMSSPKPEASDEQNKNSKCDGANGNSQTQRPARVIGPMG